MEKQPITRKMSVNALKSVQNSESIDIFPSIKSPGKMFFVCGTAKQAIANKLLPEDAPIVDPETKSELSFTGYVSEKAVAALEGGHKELVSFAIIGDVPCLMAGTAPKFTL